MQDYLHDNSNIRLILIVALVALISCYFFYNKSEEVEGYNIGTGQFCTTCSGKTPNQCNRCFNCGWCTDKNGNGACIGGTSNGPFNYERCATWGHNDPYAYMLQRNANYKCSYGPRSSNRLIGI